MPTERESPSTDPPSTPRVRDRRSPLHHDPDSLRWAVQRTGWVARELAAKVGVSAGHFSELMRGTRSAPPRLLMAIAVELNCPVSMLERKIDEHAAAEDSEVA